jgi:hypothetical protein
MPSSRDQVFELLKDDHAQVKRQFTKFEKLDVKGDGAAKVLADRICAALEVHAMLEEELFYPAARAALADGDVGLLDEAQVEHGSLKTLIAELQGIDGGDPMFSAHVKVLGEYVKHHVKEEEGEMFDRLSRAKLDWDSLLHDMQQRHDALMAEHGLAEPAASAAQSPRVGAGGTSAKTGR